MLLFYNILAFEKKWYPDHILSFMFCACIEGHRYVNLYMFELHKSVSYICELPVPLHVGEEGGGKSQIQQQVR